MAHIPIWRYLVLTAAALALTGCAAQRAYHQANELMAHEQVEAGLHKYREAVAADPGNAFYKLSYLRARDGAVLRLLEQAGRALATGNVEDAQQDYQRVLSFAPANDLALAGLRKVGVARRHALTLQEATEAMGKKQYELARKQLDSILTEQPDHPAALALAEKLNAATRSPAAETGLAAGFRKPISLEFRDAPLRQVLEAISRHSGLNFLFDKDVRPEQRTSIFLKDSTVEAAVYFLLMSNQLERQIMDRSTILIFPNTPAKQKEYQEMTVKTFYLSSAEAKNVAGNLKTILRLREVAIDEKLNLVIVRDTADAIKLANRMVALLDVPEPEVMLDVEVLEVERNRMTELGVVWPASLSLAPLSTSSGQALTIDALRGLNGGKIGVGDISATLNAHKDDGYSNTLANPRIRVRNKEKAKVVIGDKLPTITTTISPGVGGFASESVNYLDVGLTLNVEPTIHLDNEVAIRISLEVSNVVDSMTTKSGSVVYRIGNRSATTLLQLKDGENQVLAGLIKNEDRRNGRKIPLLGDVPLLGRLFGSQKDSADKTEIVLSITPHLVRNIQRPPADQSEFVAGTDSVARQRPESGLPVVAVADASARAPWNGGPGSAFAPPAAFGAPVVPPQLPAVAGNPAVEDAAGTAAQQVLSAAMPARPEPGAEAPLHSEVK